MDYNKEQCYLKDKCLKYKQGNCDKIDFCMKLFRTDYLLSQALLTDAQKAHINLYIDSDGTDKNIFLALKDCEKNINNLIKSGKNLYLYSSNTGCGKTSWALRLLQSYINSIWYKSDMCCKALFINIPRFLLALKSCINPSNIDDINYVNHIKENILKADLVIWDEVGSKVGTQFELDNLLSMINLRIDSNKSNIYTSNLAPDELLDFVGPRIHSRIINLSDIYEFRGKDKRCLK